MKHFNAQTKLWKTFLYFWENRTKKRYPYNGRTSKSTMYRRTLKYTQNLTISFWYILRITGSPGMVIPHSSYFQ